MRILLNNKNFRVLVIAQVINGFGDSITNLALPLYVYLYTGSALSAATTGVMSTLGFLLFGPLLSPLTDRKNRRAVLSFFLGVQSLLVAAIAFVVPISIPLLYMLILAQAACFSVSRSALQAYTEDCLHDPKELENAASTMEAIDSLCQALGAILAGYTISKRLPQIAFFTDASTFIIAAYLVYRTSPFRFPIPEDSVKYIIKIKEGLTGVKKDIKLKLSIALSFLVGAVGGPFVFALVPHMKIMSGLSDSTIGFIGAGQGLAYMIGNFLPKIEKLKCYNRFVISLIIIIIGALFLGFSRNIAGNLLGVIFVCSGVGFNVILTRTTTQKLSPTNIKGRVMLIRLIAIRLGSALYFAACAPLIARHETSWVYLGGVFILGVGVLVGSTLGKITRE